MQGYEALLKIRKRQLDEARHAVAKAYAHIHTLTQNLRAARMQFRQLALPGEGSGRLFSGYLLQKESVTTSVKTLESLIEKAQANLVEVLETLKQANIAYEQAKALEGEMLQKRLARMKAHETKALDEMGGIAYWRRNA